MPATTVHAHYPLAVVVPVSARHPRRRGRGLRQSTAAGLVVASERGTRFAPGIPAIMLMVGACSPLGLRLRGFLAGRAAAPIPPLAAEPFRDLIADRREEDWESVSAAWARFSALCEERSRPVWVDPRLVRAWVGIDEGVGAEGLTLDERAASVALHPAVSVRCSIVRRSCRFASTGDGSPAAGHSRRRRRDAAAGRRTRARFADQAHLIRTCRSSFGLAGRGRPTRFRPLAEPGAAEAAAEHAGDAASRAPEADPQSCPKTSLT
jgi:hypothetical protein